MPENGGFNVIEETKRIGNKLRKLPFKENMNVDETLLKFHVTYCLACLNAEYQDNVEAFQKKYGSQFRTSLETLYPKELQ